MDDVEEDWFSLRRVDAKELDGMFHQFVVLGPVYLPAELVCKFHHRSFQGDEFHQCEDLGSVLVCMFHRLLTEKFLMDLDCMFRLSEDLGLELVSKAMDCMFHLISEMEKVKFLKELDGSFHHRHHCEVSSCHRRQKDGSFRRRHRYEVNSCHHQSEVNHLRRRVDCVVLERRS